MGKLKGKAVTHVPIVFRFKRIDLTSQSEIDIPEGFSNAASEEIKYQLQMEYVNDKGGNIILTLKYSLLHFQHVVYSFGTRSLFTVSQADANTLAKSDSEEGFARKVAEISLFHSRGLQSTVINDTPVEKYYIPFLDAKKLPIKVSNKRQLETA